MKIAGLQPFTLTDYPGKIAAIIFTQGCNFRCPFCHNGALLPPEPQSGKLMPEDAFFEFLEKRRGKLDGVVVSGGEPTLQSDLAEFAAKIKTMGFLVKLDTNGSRPKVLKNLLKKGLVDFVAMDIKAPFEKYGILTGLEDNCCRPQASLGYARQAGLDLGSKTSKKIVSAIKESIKNIAASGVEHLFRTTFVDKLMSRKDLEKIKNMVPKSSKWIVQKFEKENALKGELRK
ncbi:anaerobic ribonucleoside-triphosphate reductase activating protein [Candidatus Dependentiae bacterium]